MTGSWPKPGRISANFVAEKYNKEIAEQIEKGVAAGRGRPTLVGLLANGDPAGEMYAKMTQRACEKIGVAYELRRPERLDLETEVIVANDDPSVHGLLVYYPVFGGGKDMYLRDVVSVEKDVEGLNHQYCYSLYHNIRELPGGKKVRKTRHGLAVHAHHHTIGCVLPCTPLACVKVLEELHAYDTKQPVGKQLSGRTAVVYNRSEVVGRPLAAMLANDGAKVYSIDEYGMLLYTAGAVKGTIKVEETAGMASEDALKSADIVVGGVPSKAFKIAASSIREGAICINVSQHMNFGEGTDARCALVPAMGKVTIAMLARNLLRLHSNFHELQAQESCNESGNPLLSIPKVVASAAVVVGIAVGSLLARMRTAPA